MKKRIFPYLTAVFILLIGLTLVFPFALKLLVVPVTKKELGNRVYIPSNLPELHQKELEQLLNASEKRVDSLLQKRISDPFWVFIGEQEGKSTWNLPITSPASTLYLPGISVILVKPRGWDVNVLSHELMHAELKERLGWSSMQNKVPVWFDEGFGLLADYRYHHLQAWEASFAVKNLPPVDSLITRESFQRYSEISPMLSYYPAFIKVREWWQKDQRVERLERLSEAIEKGQLFEQALEDH